VARFFPRARRRHVVALGVLVALACAPIASPLATADDLKHKQSKVKQGISHAQHDLDESSSALNAAQARLGAAQGKLAVAQRKLAGTQAQLNAAAVLDREMQARLESAERDLADARTSVRNSRRQIRDQRAQIGRVAAASYSYGDPQLMGLSAMLDAQNAGQITSQLGTVDSMMNQQTASLRKLQATRTVLVVQKNRVQQAELQVASQRAQAARNLVHKRDLQQAAATDAAAVAVLVTSRQAAESQARRIRSADVKVLQSLQRQEERIKRQIMARARHQRNHHVADVGGLLYRPVPGVVTSPYGWRIHPIYHYWGLHDGTDFSAPCGTHEHAADSGRVVSEYYSSVWGNRLYLDLGKINGSNFTVIYNHLSGYKAHTGQHVGRGDTVGYAGTTGWSTGCHLHFTVLKNGNPVDPMKYM
jgi:murein DD-endopeptidase MepM/ murein hydrolase activator NlpD